MAKYEAIIDSEKKIMTKMTLVGWVDSIRHHGKLSFCDLRDDSAKIQIVFTGEPLLKKIKNVSVESVVEVTGKIVKRQRELVNTKQRLGAIELMADSLTVFSLAEPLPFPIDGDTRKIEEKIRLQYRYLDLRSMRMQNNIRVRHKVILFLRNYYNENGFIEIETPQLTRGTPEGSREFIIPSRIHQGSFYVLPQSPQQFKQLLMVSGVKKYFQVARCFRDEDQRQDRQPEFTQWDLEMSFVDEEDIMQLVEKSMIALVSGVFPHKEIMQKPFPRITYLQSMKQYSSDKPDMRSSKNENLLSFCWVTKFPLFETAETKTGITSSHHPFMKPLEEDIKKIDIDPLSVRSATYDLVLNGYEIGSGGIRINNSQLQKKIFLALGLSNSETEEKFGHILKAFSFGVPPHGGIALGLDRLIAVILNENNIREVIAFPKTGEGKDLLMRAPSELPDETLHQVGIKKLKKRD